MEEGVWWSMLIEYEDKILLIPAKLLLSIAQLYLVCIGQLSEIIYSRIVDSALNSELTPSCHLNCSLICRLDEHRPTLP